MNYVSVKEPKLNFMWSKNIQLRNKSEPTTQLLENACVGTYPHTHFPIPQPSPPHIQWSVSLPGFRAFKWLCLEMSASRVGKKGVPFITVSKCDSDQCRPPRQKPHSPPCGSPSSSRMVWSWVMNQMTS